jgi:hypothetical protein
MAAEARCSGSSDDRRSHGFEQHPQEGYVGEHRALEVVMEAEDATGECAATESDRLFPP